jgi:hypothetical protein
MMLASSMGVRDVRPNVGIDAMGGRRGASPAWTWDVDPSTDMDATDVESARWGGRDIESSVGIDGAHFGAP